MCSLDIWDFYLSETLETGCPYDLDIALAEHGEHLNDAELRQRNKCISAIYDDISLCLPDFFNGIVTVGTARTEDRSRTMSCPTSRKSPIRCNRRMANRGRSTGIKSRHLNERKHRYGCCIHAGSHLSMIHFQRLSIQDEAFKRVNAQPNYLQQPQRSLSSSISSSRTSSIYGSHTYESTQFSTPQICDTCDELIDAKRSPNGLTRSSCSSPFERCAFSQKVYAHFNAETVPTFAMRNADRLPRVNRVDASGSAARRTRKSWSTQVASKQAASQV
jgi:hypothetical protein